MVRPPSHPPWRAEASGGPIGHHATPDQFENPSWLKVGFELLQWLATFSRDYLLPKLKPNFAVFEKKADVVTVSAAVLQRAGIPAIAQGLTEHSERAVLPTGLSVLGVMLGFMEAGWPSSS